MPTRDIGYRRDVLIDIPAETPNVAINPVCYSRKLQVESGTAGNEKLAQILRGRYRSLQICHKNQASIY
jgi:hypothetical protein